MNVERPKLPSGWQHYGGFLTAGIAALTTDAIVLTLLTNGLGLSPFTARIFSISVAMVASWLINRTMTFAVTTTPTFAEFARFAMVSWLAQAVNYAIFAAVLLLRPETHPVAALIAASLVAMFVSYVGFRFGVFRKS